MGQNEQLYVFSDLIALQKGIIHPKIFDASKIDAPASINIALASMTKEDARRCKRKFRKLAKKAINKKIFVDAQPHEKRRAVLNKIHNETLAIIHMLDNKRLDE